MEINDLLKKEITGLSEEIKNIIVKYRKKKTVEGMISESHHNPFKVEISQRDVKDPEEKFHEIDFEKAVEIAIYYYNGKISVHADSKYTE
ncbi:hypothetical protein [Chryseobacterium foetidum]|uniref:hypothetical protein n=1 Tax=Chryseobacterium foetidum TaxID=2951057 RepID=UPI0021C86988|nr:hypothetical protein [Chryseobacterium foetidum]